MIKHCRRPHEVAVNQQWISGWCEMQREKAQPRGSAARHAIAQNHLLGVKRWMLMKNISTV